MSNEFDWDLERLENAVDADELTMYDVREAKRLVIEGPRPVEQLELTELRRKLFQEQLEGIKLKPEGQRSYVDTALPVIFGRNPAGRKFLLDGWHRMEKALELPLTHLPVITLTEEETAAIKMI